MTATTPFFVIIGLGKTGLSCAKYCVEHGVSFAVTDSRSSPPGLMALKKLAPQAQLALGKLSSTLIRQATTLLVSPGIATDDPTIIDFINDNVDVIGDVELFMRQVTQPVIAITGSNGKTTVTTLVGEMMKQADRQVAVAGNIGLPVLEVLSANVDSYVLELSSFQLESTPSIHSHIAVLLNICEDHLDRYPDVSSYLEAKKHIFDHCQTAIVCRHDHRLYPDNSALPLITFGLDAPQSGHFGVVDYHGQQYLAYCLTQGQKRLLPLSQLALSTDHQLLNIIAALAIGHAAGLEMVLMLSVISHFTELPHRCQLVDEFAGVRWYNDSKATNVAATISALSGLGKRCDGKIVLIAGGQDKGMDFSPLKPVVQQFARKVIVIGEMARQLQIQLAGIVDVEQVNNLEQAVSLAELTARRGDAVLLSPACSSLDMFDNFEHRGETFIQLVKSL